MKKFIRMSKVRNGLIAAVVVSLVGVGLLQHSSAAVGQIYMSPGSASIQKDDTKTFQVRLHPTSAVDSVNATINYDQTKLQFVSISGSGSAFTIPLSETGGGGSVNIQRGILGSTVSGDSLVASVKFKALVGGSVSTKLDLSGYTLSGGTQNNPTAVDATVTLTSAVSSTPPSSDGGTTKPPSSDGGDSGSGSGTGSGSSTGSGGDDGSGGSEGGGAPTGGDGSDNQNNPFQINVKQKRVELTRVAFEVNTSERAKAYILFGTEQDQLKVSSKTTKLGKSHTIGLPESLMIPGTTFYYKAIAEDKSGNKAVSGIQSFKTKGFTIHLTVLDKFDRPIKNSKIRFFSEPMEGTTDENGVVTFNDVAPGTHHVEYTQDGQTHSQTVKLSGDVPIKQTADGAQTADPQKVTATLSTLEFTERSILPVMPTIIAVSILFALAGGYLVLKKRRANSYPGYAATTPHAQQSQPTPLPGDNQEPTIENIQGVSKPDPGSVVNPRHDDEENN